MSEKINFLGGAVTSLREEYKERLKYKKLVNLPGLIDMWYDNYEYGYLNEKYNLMILAEDSEFIKSFDGVADSVSALNFVTDCFMAFRGDYVNKVNNSLFGYPPFLEGMTPKAGYQSFEALYSDWSAYSAVKYSSFMEDDSSIFNFDTFLESLKKSFIEQVVNFPITKSGFLLSHFNDIRTTGLIIDLATLNHNIDIEKGEIVQSFEFQCFLEMANLYGFYVDKNAPWRLVANLDSPTMRIFIRDQTSGSVREDIKNFTKIVGENKKHKNLTTRQILDNIYRIRTHHDDLYVLQDFVLKVYNQIVRNVPHFQTVHFSNLINGPVNQDVFRTGIRYLSAEEWIELLVMVRLLEVNHYTEQKYQHYCKIMLDKYSVFGLRRTISFLGDEMSLLIKENFTKAREDRIIANAGNVKKGIRTGNATRRTPQPTQRTPSPGGSSSGY